MASHSDAQEEDKEMTQGSHTAIERRNERENVEREATEKRNGHQKSVFEIGKKNPENINRKTTTPKKKTKKKNTKEKMKEM